MKWAAFFPKRLFFWIVAHQAVIFLVLIAILSGSVLFWIEKSTLDADAKTFGRVITLITIGWAFVAFFFVSVLVAAKLVLPLGRLIEKARILREFPFETDEPEPEAITFDEPGEWFDLERALNRLGHDLRNKTIRLSREKTEFRTIMSAITEAVLAISNEKRLLFYNSQFAYVFNPKSHAADATISEILREPDVIAAYDEALKSAQPVRRELHISVADGTRAHVFQLSVAPLKKKHNQEVYGAVGIFHDITELKQAERIRIDFVGNVSHELRTPLTTINGYLQTLTADLKSGRTDQAQEFLGVVSKNVSRLKSLVDDLLDLSALESGKALRFESVDVQEVTEDVLKQVNTRGHKIKIHYGIKQMTADAKRLEQVLRNLMENAVRYVPEGRDVNISWVESGDGSAVELHVKDNGPGIGPEHQARLFERFYRIDEARSRETGGTGIGLSLVKHIVQRHGGNVQVRSELGSGSEFICEFPRILN